MSDRSRNVFKEIVGDRVAEDDDRRAAILIVLREERAVGQRPVLGERPVGRHAVDGGLIVGVADPQGRAVGTGGNGGGNVVEFGKARGVVHGQRRDRRAAHAGSGRARPDKKQVRAHGFNARHHLLLAAFPDRQHGDDRSDADNDAQ